MNQLFYNDQAYIAEGFHLAEDFTAQTALLAYFKINSYKETLLRSSYRKTKEELRTNIQASLFNYTSPCIILADLGFFQSESDN